MEIFVEIFDGTRKKVFDTLKDKKKLVNLTNVVDLQKEAIAYFYANGKRIKTLDFKNLPPAKARALDLPVIIELIDNNKFTVSYYNKDNLLEKEEIAFGHVMTFSDIVKKNRIIISIIASLLILISLLFLFFKFNIGSYLLSLNDKKNNKNIEQKQESSSESSNISSKESQVIKSIYTLESLRKIVEDNSPLCFIYDTAILLEGEQVKLNTITDYLKNYKKIEMIINGHTETVNKPDDEMALSLERANFIKNFLSEKVQNIDLNFKIKGYGATKPLLPNAPKEKMYLNRRVEFEVISAE